MTKKRTVAYSVLIGLIALLVGAALVIGQVRKVDAIFAANDARKAEGYYLSEFEFELLSVSYYLDKGRYLDGLRRLNEIHAKFVDSQGLVKVPAFSSVEEQLDFYLDRQNPETGAFYPNATDPVFAYAGVTANMINLIDDLSRRAGRPFALKYPLRFLERIDTPSEMTAALDDSGRVGFIGTKLKPLFVSSIELNDLLEQCERLDIYPFPAEAKTAFLQWFYDNQDPQTGLWGPRDRASGAIIDGGDIGDSGKIIKLFVDDDAKEIHPEFPLRYSDRILASTIERLSTPLPARLDETHRWIIDRDRGFRLLTKYIWAKGSEEDRDTIRDMLSDFVRLRFERFFVPADGAFSLYPDSDAANLDGTSEAGGMLDYIGALTPDRQKRLWGDASDLGTAQVDEVTGADLDPVAGKAEVNAIRFYADDPQGDYLRAVAAVYYPRATPVLDMVDLVPRIETWLDTTTQTMGNWGSKDGVRERLSVVTVDPAPVIETGDVAGIERLLQENGSLVAIGFDVLQAPRYRMQFVTG